MSTKWVEGDLTLTRQVDDAAWEVWLHYEAGNFQVADRLRIAHIERFKEKDCYFNVDAFNFSCRTP